MPERSFPVGSLHTPGSIAFFPNLPVHGPHRFHPPDSHYPVAQATGIALAHSWPETQTSTFGQDGQALEVSLVFVLRPPLPITFPLRSLCRPPSGPAPPQLPFARARAPREPAGMLRRACGQVPPWRIVLSLDATFPVLALASAACPHFTACTTPSLLHRFEHTFQRCRDNLTLPSCSTRLLATFSLRMWPLHRGPPHP